MTSFRSESKNLTNHESNERGLLFVLLLFAFGLWPATAAQTPTPAGPGAVHVEPGPIAPRLLEGGHPPAGLLKPSPTPQAFIAPSLAHTLTPASVGAVHTPPPGSFTAKQTGAGTVQLSWASVPGASSYKLSGAGIPSAGIQITDTTHTVTGLSGPGMYSWRLSASGAPITLPGQSQAQSAWVTGTTSGLSAPTLPSPSFYLISFNIDEGARNDQQGRVAKTSLSLPASPSGNQNPCDCPYTPMFLYDNARAPVPAAGWYFTSSGDVQPDTDPACAKYTILFGNTLYLRAPTFPGLTYVRPPAYNTWVFVVNCRGEYSNARQFRVYPTDFELGYADAIAYSGGQWVTLNGYVGGTQLNLHGTGFAGLAPNDQTVFFHFELGKTNASGTGLDLTTRDIAAAPAFPQSTDPAHPDVMDERQINVLVPSLEGAGYGKNDGYVLLKSTVYVKKGYQTSAALPVRVCSTSASAATIAGNGPCW